MIEFTLAGVAVGALALNAFTLHLLFKNLSGLLNRIQAPDLARFSALEEAARGGSDSPAAVAPLPEDLAVNFYEDADADLDMLDQIVGKAE